VDPVSLAGAVVALVAPYLKRVLEGSADRAAEAAADAALPAAKRLFEAVKRRLRPGSYQAAQLEGVEEMPSSEGRQAALKTALVELFESEPALITELEPLVKAAEAEAGIRITASDAGIVAGGDVHQQGTYTAGRDQHIGR
jgi:hypothetical protein